MEALQLLENIANQYENVSYADLFQFASGVAVEACSLAVSCNLGRESG